MAVIAVISVTIICSPSVLKYAIGHTLLQYVFPASAAISTACLAFFTYLNYRIKLNGVVLFICRESGLYDHLKAKRAIDGKSEQYLYIQVNNACRNAITLSIFKSDNGFEMPLASKKESDAFSFNWIIEAGKRHHNLFSIDTKQFETLKKSKYLYVIDFSGKPYKLSLPDQPAK